MESFEIGDMVKKKSRKPFINGEKTATIHHFGTKSIPNSNGNPKKCGTCRVVTVAYFSDCESFVALERLERVE